ncbi:Uncharacterised protein [Mycobacterium tuberculosis]|nr:Uncharacterised protein [Mycobacterium tuberculosis]
MCPGEQDALGGKPVQPRAVDVRMVVDAEIAPQVVPVHDQQVLALPCGTLTRHLCHLSSEPHPAPKPDNRAYTSRGTRYATDDGGRLAD